MERILIAEDEERLAAFLEDGLTEAGYAATVVGDGLGAVALARDEDFELLILDLGLPGLDGMEVLRALRAQGRRLSVLILSARDDSHTKVEGLELGANDYLTKPFGFDELLGPVVPLFWFLSGLDLTGFQTGEYRRRRAAERLERARLRV